MDCPLKFVSVYLTDCKSDTVEKKYISHADGLIRPNLYYLNWGAPVLKFQSINNPNTWENGIFLGFAQQCYFYESY